MPEDIIPLSPRQPKPKQPSTLGKPGTSDKPAVADKGAKPATPGTANKPTRLTSLDAYRGFIMLMMASAGFGFAEVAKSFPESRFWQTLAGQFGHVAWTGCAFWDLIQPAFMFMVGVALPYSYARRREQGGSYFGALWHTVVRSVVLVLLGVFLASTSSTQTNFIFTNVLAQIGLGYPFLFVLVNRGKIVQLLTVAAILGGYWYAFHQHPLPPEGFDYTKVGVTAEDIAGGAVQSGEFAHWNKNANFASDQDQRLLNKFPQEKPFVFNSGGYTTLNFVPSLATMVLGLMVGELLRSGQSPGRILLTLVAAGLVCMLLGLLAGWTACPIVKRIWTPAWALFSAGYIIWMLAAFYGVIDVAGWRWWSFPLVVVGMNSIAMYMMSQLLRPWVAKFVSVHLGTAYSKLVALPMFANTALAGTELYSGVYGPIIKSLAILFMLWLACLWLYRQKIFVKI